MRVPRRSFFNLLATLCVGVAAFSSCAQAQNASAADPRGRWITASGNLEVEVAPCGAALCGTVTQVLGNRSMGRDAEPMQPADNRPALGMKLLKDFVPSATGADGITPTQWSGEIYNRENGKTYSCQMSLDTQADGSKVMVLRVYVGLPLFGKTQRWQRAASAPSAVSQH